MCCYFLGMKDVSSVPSAIQTPANSSWQAERAGVAKGVRMEARRAETPARIAWRLGLRQPAPIKGHAPKQYFLLTTPFNIRSSV